MCQKLELNGCGYEKGKNTKFKNRKRFFTFLYPLLSDWVFLNYFFLERRQLINFNH